MVYRKRILYPAQASIIIAPSGSGKSVANHVQQLFEPLHERMIQENTLKNGLFLADNFTLASLTKTLSENNGVGIIASSDAGFFLSMISKNPGQLQGIFRTTLSEEPLRNGRSIKKSTTKVSHPKLAISLSALPQEVSFLFNDPKDGVNSRFLPYMFVPDGIWNNLEGENIESYYKRVSYFTEQINSFHEFCSKHSYEFSFTEEQYDAFNSRFGDQFSSTNQDAETVIFNSIVVRMQIHVIRLAMVLATLRAWQSNFVESRLLLTADDFDSIMRIGTVYMEHAIAVAKLNPYSTAPTVSPQQQKYYDTLPDKFKLKEALDIAKVNGLKISERTVSNYLKKFIKMEMLDHEYNSYVKPMYQRQTA